MLQQIDTAIAFTVVMLMLSLMVTAAVQMISALMDLRGRNLAWGLENLLKQVEPEFRGKLPDGSTIAEHIAQVVVKHPAIAHAGTRAKAVSKSELIGVLRDLCSNQPAITIDDEAKTKLKALLDQQVPRIGQAVAAAETVAKQLNIDLPGQEAKVKAAVDSAFATVSKLEHQVGQWFDTVMNRLSDIFTRHTRVITVVVSVLFVVSLHIDSGEILGQITRSPELRAKLTAMSDSELSQADKIFDNSERSAAALADVRKNHATKPDGPQILAAIDKVPPHLTRCADGGNSLAEVTKGLPDAEALLEEFNNACQSKTKQAMGNAYDEMRGLRDDLKKTDLKIAPAEINGNVVFNSGAQWLAAYRVRRHLAGTLASILLLSLGAPFWFNTLRQLSNLKPAIADKVGGPK
ncbi:MAG TPA: hypothetical protein VJN92_19760 [Candidatus Acidoferrum sp.]|nr:hypothetical protein [Candidatus Acidoferrum sp.]